MINAFVFELSKVEVERVRERMVANLCNVDTMLAQCVATGLGFKQLPKATPSQRPVRDDLPLSPALRIVNGPLQSHSIKARQLALLVHDASDASIVRAIISACKDAGATLHIVAVRLGGIALSDGSSLRVDKQLAGYPSVFVDAIGVVLSGDATKLLLSDVNAVQFVSMAFQHVKAIGFNEEVSPLLSKAGVNLDEGVVPFNDSKGHNIDAFVVAAARRFWQHREAAIHQQ